MSKYPGERFDLGYLPSNVNPTHFICRDCEETIKIEFECGIPNGQAGVNVGKEYCIVMKFCKKCVDKRYSKYKYKTL